MHKKAREYQAEKDNNLKINKGRDYLSTDKLLHQMRPKRTAGIRIHNRLNNNVYHWMTSNMRRRPLINSITD